MSHHKQFQLDPSFLETLVARLRSAGCVFAEEEAQLLVSSACSQDELDVMVERRTSGSPLEYVLGWAEFYGLRISVDSGVFVPRRRTEFLASQAISLTRPFADPVVVDLCCGTGAIGAALAVTLGQVELYASDIDPAAVTCAHRNIGAVGVVYEGDLFDPLPQTLQGHVHVLIANVPYVPTEAIELLPPEAREYEALVALDGGTDGLDLQRRVASSAPHWLAPGGHLLFETSEKQVPKTVEIFASNGLNAKVVISEEMDATVVIGTRPL